jgi:hypothetical protein
VFHGAAGFTFPVKNVTSVDMINLQGTACATMVFVYTEPAQSYSVTLTLCEGGNWSLDSALSRGNGPNHLGSGSVPGSSSYHIAVTSDGTTATFAINSESLPPVGINQAAVAIGFGVQARGASRASVSLDNFAIVATP